MPGRSRGGGPRSRRIGTASRQNGALISRCVLAPLEDLETAAVDREPASASGPPSSSTSTSRAVPRVPRPTRAGRPSRARAQRAPALLRPGEAASRLASPTPTLTQVRHPRGVQPPRTGEDASIEAALLARAARIEASAPPPFRALLDDAIAQRRETIRRGISWPWASSSALGTTSLPRAALPARRRETRLAHEAPRPGRLHPPPPLPRPARPKARRPWAEFLRRRRRC